MFFFSPDNTASIGFIVTFLILALNAVLILYLAKHLWAEACQSNHTVMLIDTTLRLIFTRAKHIWLRFKLRYLSLRNISHFCATLMIFSGSVRAAIFVTLSRSILLERNMYNSSVDVAALAMLISVTSCVAAISFFILLTADCFRRLSPKLIHYHRFCGLVGLCATFCNLAAGGLLSSWRIFEFTSITTGCISFKTMCMDVMANKTCRVPHWNAFDLCDTVNERKTDSPDLDYRNLIQDTLEAGVHAHGYQVIITALFELAIVILFMNTNPHATEEDSWSCCGRRGETSWGDELKSLSVTRDEKKNKKKRVLEMVDIGTDLRVRQKEMEKKVVERSAIRLMRRNQLDKVLSAESKDSSNPFWMHSSDSRMEGPKKVTKKMRGDAYPERTFVRRIRSLSTGRGRAPEGDKSSYTNPMLKRSKLKKEQEPEKNMEIRYDGASGWAYTKTEFQQYYGNYWKEKWDTARPPAPAQPSPPELPGPPEPDFDFDESQIEAMPPKLPGPPPATDMHVLSEMAKSLAANNDSE